MAPSYTQWWDANMLRYLPLPYDEVIKSCSSIVSVAAKDTVVDGYYEYYRPFEFSIISDLFAFTVSHSTRFLNHIFFCTFFYFFFNFKIFLKICLKKKKNFN